MKPQRALGLTPFLFAVPFVLTACSSAELKQRQEIRDRVVKSSHIYCEFMNGDAHPDIDVAVNIAMGAKCDSNKDFSLTTYRTPAEINGVLFCCGTKEPKADTLPELPTRRESIRVPPKTEESAAEAATPRPKTNVRVTPNKTEAAAAATATATTTTAPPPAAPAAPAAPAVAPAAPAPAPAAKPAPAKAAKPAVQFEADPEAGE